MNKHTIYENKKSAYVFGNYDKKIKKKKNINKDYYYIKRYNSNSLCSCNSCYNKNSCSRCNSCYNNCNSTNNWMNNNNCYEVLYNGPITVYKKCCSNSVDYNYD